MSGCLRRSETSQRLPNQGHKSEPGGRSIFPCTQNIDLSYSNGLIFLGWYNIQFETTNMSQYMNLKTTKLIQDYDDSQSLYVPEGRGTDKASKGKKGLKNKDSPSGEQTLNRNAWNLRENILYMQFLKENLPLFMMSLRQKKHIGINILVSQFVKTRDSSQCRSHHQKMLKYHGSISKIIAHIQHLEKTLQVPSEQSPSILIFPQPPPQTPPVELKEIEFFRQDPQSMWQSLVQMNHEFEV